ncbi:transposase [Streptomyces sp. NPDC002734]|uniref:IS701 family transposase n=1 Tax=Streptomyces sp. NPDC002734 TaxID=3154426 RepID=UPI0033304A0D
MNAQVVASHRTREDVHLVGHGRDDLGAVLFSSLRRSDQRLRARQYLGGLLAAQGRKSIRNIATLTGGAAVEQSLHHFISSSTWDWSPIRAALVEQVEQVLAPRAWVVRPLFIPKAGDHSVGVERQLVPELGQEANGQLAFGTWAVGEKAAVPVRWRLRLPESWLEDPRRRRRAEIPDDAEAETPDECATTTALTALRRWREMGRPVLLDARVSGLSRLVRPFVAAGVPLLTRVRAGTRLIVADPAVPGHRAGAIPAHRILESVRSLRRPLGTATGPVHPLALVSTVRVRLAESGFPTELLLIGEWHDDGRTPTALWLSAPSGATDGDMVRATRLAGRVARDEKQIGQQVGLRDFEGRSFRGWHRHMTLASVAHSVSALERPDALDARTRQICA